MGASYPFRQKGGVTRIFFYLSLLSHVYITDTLQPYLNRYTVWKKHEKFFFQIIQFCGIFKNMARSGTYVCRAVFCFVWMRLCARILPRTEVKVVSNVPRPQKAYRQNLQTAYGNAIINASPVDIKHDVLIWIFTTPETMVARAWIRLMCHVEAEPERQWRYDSVDETGPSTRQFMCNRAARNVKTIASYAMPIVGRFQNGKPRTAGFPRADLPAVHGVTKKARAEWRAALYLSCFHGRSAPVASLVTNGPSLTGNTFRIAFSVCLSVHLSVWS